MANTRAPEATYVVLYVREGRPGEGGREDEKGGKDERRREERYYMCKEFGLVIIVYSYLSFLEPA